MQTAAHIELAVWQTTMHAEGIDLHSVEDYRGYVSLKLSTQELLKRFRTCADRCPSIIADRIRAMADEIADGLETRNLAAHGAFFVEDQLQGTLGAAHYFARGKRSARELFEVKQTFSRQKVAEIIQIANKLLQNVIELRSDVVTWRYPSGLPDPTELTSAETSPST